MQLAGKNPISNNTEAKAKEILSPGGERGAVRGTEQRRALELFAAARINLSRLPPVRRPAQPRRRLLAVGSIVIATTHHHHHAHECDIYPSGTATAMDNDPSIHLSLCLRVSDPRQASYGGQRTEQGGAVEPGRQDGARHRRKQRDRVSTHTTRRASVLLRS